VWNVQLDFIPLCKSLNLEEVKDGTHYEALLQFHFPTLLEVQPRDIVITLLQKNVITYVICVFPSYVITASVFSVHLIRFYTALWDTPRVFFSQLLVRGFGNTNQKLNNSIETKTVSLL